MRLNHCAGSPLSSANTHWLDHAKESYSETEISETKSVLDVITVFIAYPVFWALYEQQVGKHETNDAKLDNRHQCNTMINN